MTDFISSLHNWHALFALSNTMLNLARAGRWDELIDHEVKYVSLVEEIALNPLPAGNATLQEKARALLVKILSNESELKTLLQSRMSELQTLIDQTGKQKSLTTAYGKLSGNILIPNEFNP
ncbi:flagella biosynthesis regulatory protein FliT [Trabulsiella odontotermitis]|uniref:flagella biosynthesis regulatory protein FliT n=1 Tax=Trabulsiella odontotermitis TaxID=379893 RepID=UPI0006BA297F|nr:flagella biosynthesis regulatory protein FliT [Trabulsiella odontotermitis]